MESLPPAEAPPRDNTARNIIIGIIAVLGGFFLLCLLCVVGFFVMDATGGWCSLPGAEGFLACP